MKNLTKEELEMYNKSLDKLFKPTGLNLIYQRKISSSQCDKIVN